MCLLRKYFRLHQFYSIRIQNLSVETPCPKHIATGWYLTIYISSPPYEQCRKTKCDGWAAK